MLDLGQLVGHLPALSLETRRRRDESAKQMDTALNQSSKSGDEWVAMVQRMRAAKTKELLADPLFGGDESIAVPFDTPTPPAVYTAIATDGSQIPLDRHGAAPYFVINIGKIALHYGGSERAQLTSDATLLYREEDILIGGEIGEQSYVGDRQISTRRFLLETSELAALIRANAAREKAIALVDGTLILWTQEAEQDATRAESIRQLLAMLADARSANVAVCGYLSRPGSREVINALKVTLCPDGVTSRKSCTETEHACEQLNRLTDAALFAKLLSPGQRSTVFKSQSKVLSEYESQATSTFGESEGENYRIAFFYVNVGHEIARVEVPIWLALDRDMLNLTHTLVIDQAAKGAGYPIALCEAHEQAIVRGPERTAFTQLMESHFIRNGVTVEITRKAVSKRAPIL